MGTRAPGDSIRSKVGEVTAPILPRRTSTPSPFSVGRRRAANLLDPSEASRQRLENYVLGSWRAGSGKLAPLHDPTTGEQVAEAGTGGIDMKAVLDHARTVGGPRLSEMTFAQRGAMLA